MALNRCLKTSARKKNKQPLLRHTRPELQRVETTFRIPFFFFYSVDCFDQISIKEIFSYFRLTVEEHVWFYGCMKGLSEAEVKAELDTLLEDVGLLHKRHEQTKNLSGKVTSLTPVC